jgi:hypothetical protein
MKTLMLTGGLTHPKEFVANTETPFVINPGEAELQSTFNVLVPCPDTIIPGDATVQV